MTEYISDKRTIRGREYEHSTLAGYSLYGKREQERIVSFAHRRNNDYFDSIERALNKANNFIDNWEKNK